MTPQVIAFVKSALPFLTLIANIIIFVLLGLIAWAWKTKKEPRLLTLTKKNALVFSLIVAWTAMLGSLFYSEIAKFTPCKLCWLERILMYPIALILVIAHIREDKKIFVYTAFLSLLGIPLTLYHYLLQIGIIPPTECSTVGYAASCSETFGMSYGYITIPFMALSAFVLILIWSLIGMKKGE